MNAKEISRQLAFTLIELLVIIAILAMLLVLAFSGISRVKQESLKKQCMSNLKEIGIAFRGFGLDPWPEPYMPVLAHILPHAPDRLGAAYHYFLARSNELATPKLLICPADSKRTPAAGFTPSFSNSNVSYFVGIDAHDTSPLTLMSGDEHFTVGGQKPPSGFLGLWTNALVVWTAQRHVNQGNILFADGSVQGSDSKKLRTALSATGFITNRLAMP